jgi:NAD(P)-dependent dehydrogenase (short-subunit alcohol dehydrogenase family)
MYDFRGRIAVVSGGGQGLGAAIAKRFLDEGIEGVALLDRNEALVKETAARFDISGERALGVKCDVSEADSVAEAFAQIEARFGRVDILVNNAGFTKDGLFVRMTEADFRSVLDVHVAGTFLCTKQVIKGMGERGFGRVINMSSKAAFGNIGQANYSAAKAALIGFTKTLALETAKSGITVNCVAPSLINTEIINTIPERIMKDLLGRIPMARIGEPAEVAHIVAFFASDLAGYVTGQCLQCTGGM